jgi:hypothetical protein
MRSIHPVVYHLCISYFQLDVVLASSNVEVTIMIVFSLPVYLRRRKSFVR